MAKNLEVVVLKDKLINYLEQQIEKAKKGCDIWTDSGDQGMCYEHEVKPLIKMLEWVREQDENERD